MIEWREVRCDGTFKGRGTGRCDQLIMRIGLSTVGKIETKCPRCKTLRTIKIDAPAMARQGAFNGNLR